ncbi:MAG: class I SAM-dependent methyltransferase [Planctomycetota bacterium]|nr:class I SAM-dependent methyltransferase [Planctomycetota bacterium]
MNESIESRLLRARNNERWPTVYREAPEIFRAFERAEDPEGLAAKRLAELAGVRGKRVLEIGCGTGWLTRVVAPLAERHIAVEPELGMLRRAEDLGAANVLRARGEQLPVASRGFDRIVMSWVLLDLRPSVRSAVLAECDRVIRVAADTSSGAVSAKVGTWVIENAAMGEFQELRGIEDTEGPGEVRPLIDECGFEVVETVETELRFADAAEAELVLGAILGDEARAKLQRRPTSVVPLHLAILFRAPR